MKRIVLIVVAMLLAAGLTHCYHADRQYVNTGSKTTLLELENKYNSLHQRLSKVEEIPRHITPYRVWGAVSSADQPHHELLQMVSGQGSTSNQVFKIKNFKGGPAVVPEFRLPVGSTNLHEFYVLLPGKMDRPIEAWISFPQPTGGLASFDRLDAYCPIDTNAVKISFQLKPGASAKLVFDLIVLREHSVKR